MSLVYWSVVHVVSPRDVTDPDVCVIGQGRLSCPMMCLRTRSAALTMFLPQLWLWPYMLSRLGAIFSKVIYIIAKYCMDIKIDLLWKVENLLDPLVPSCHCLNFSNSLVDLSHILGKSFTL